MRILQLTPGTGNFYCGNCIRDNTLVRALRRMGHDAILAPMYLPLLTDSAEAESDAPIFFGGVNVYLQQKLPLFRRTPAWVDSLFNARPLLNLSAKMAGMTRAKDLGELTLSMLRGQDGMQAKEIDKLISWIRESDRPDVVCLSNVLLAGLAPRLKEAIGAPVVCTLQGEDCFLDTLPEPYASECWELLARQCQFIDAFTPVSRYFGELMSRRLGLPAEKVHVVYNGISLDDYPKTPPSPPATPTLGYLARLSGGKGMGTLVDAFIEMKSRKGNENLKLRIAGTMTSVDDKFVNQQKQKLDARGLSADYEILPNLDRAAKVSFLHSLTVFSVPATYGEAFGLYLIEAMAAGVPVVQPRHAAFPEILDATGGGVLCEPDDARSLADAIELLLRDPPRARALGEQGRRAVFEKFSADGMARGVLEVYKKVVNGAGISENANAQPRAAVPHSNSVANES